MKTIAEFFKDKWEDVIYFCESWVDDAKLMGFWYPFGKLLRNIWMTLVWQWVRRITRVVQWVPVLWNNYDWDYCYILKVIDYKLARTQRALKNGMCEEEHSKEKIAEIQEVRDLIKKIDDYDFVSEEQKVFTEKYGDLKTICSEIEGKPGYRSMTSYYTKTQGNPVLEKEAEEESTRIHKLEEERNQQAYDKLFSLMAKNIRGWWD